MRLGDIKQPRNEMDQFYLEKNMRTNDSKGDRVERDKLNNKMKRLVKAVR